MSWHLPSRPSWICTECYADWPCEVQRSRLGALYRNDLVQLHLAMAPKFVQAVEDLPNHRPGAVWDRFLGWIRRDA